MGSVSKLTIDNCMLRSLLFLHKNFHCPETDKFMGSVTVNGKNSKFAFPVFYSCFRFTSQKALTIEVLLKYLPLPFYDSFRFVTFRFVSFRKI